MPSEWVALKSGTFRSRYPPDIKGRPFSRSVNERFPHPIKVDHGWRHGTSVHWGRHTHIFLVFVVVVVVVVVIYLLSLLLLSSSSWATADERTLSNDAQISSQQLLLAVLVIIINVYIYCSTVLYVCNYLVDRLKARSSKNNGEQV
jgi:hypothetical protein